MIKLVYKPVSLLVSVFVGLLAGARPGHAAGTRQGRLARHPQTGWQGVRR
jgi:hypothetical protein